MTSGMHHPHNNSPLTSPRTSPPVNTPSRLVALDGLRGIAILLVMLVHYTSRFPDFYAEALTPDFDIWFGFYGVHLFFIISGFVILMSLDRSDGEGFLRSRFLRLYPLFWLSVALTYGVRVLGPAIENTINIPTFLINLTMLNAYLRIEAVDGVYWSLAYELGFYVFLYGLFQARLRSWIGWIPVYFLLSSLSFVWLYPFIPHPFHFILVFNSYGHLFAAGLALFLLYQRGMDWRWIIVLIATPFIQFLYEDGFGAIAVGVAVGGAAAGIFVPWVAQRLSMKPLVWLGKISYALYLTHQMIGYEIMAQLQKAGAPWIVSFGITFLAAIAIAAGLTFYLEKPVVAYIRRHLTMKPQTA